MTRIAPRRALISVYDKTGLAQLAEGLHRAGVELVSTGSTAKVIAQAGVPVMTVDQVTGFPEVMDGRVKTLHPAVHAGILADRGKPEHLAALEEHGFTGIDLVVVNLYPFRDTVTDPDVTPAQAIEMIDIGGPTMVRAAAKNHAYVAVVVDPGDYSLVLGELDDHGGISLDTRATLAGAAFTHTAFYDADVATWMYRGTDFAPGHHTGYRLQQNLRYGENPHQAAAYYTDRGQPWGLGSAEQLHGKELSYNNLLDTDAAWTMAADFTEPCIAIIKHTNPAGLAVAETLTDAYPKARSGDPVSAFGGIVAANQTIDAATARQIVEIFTEVVVAPDYTDDALELLQSKKNVRVLRITNPRPAQEARSARTVSGGLLVQDADIAAEQPQGWMVPTKVKPDDELLAELAFAWQACKHVKSNAIVLSRDRAVVGVGAGQMSRVDSVRIAVEKAEGREQGAVLASDAFFPFRDGPDTALDAGVVTLISPGGSVRDEEVVAACDERGVPMVFTGRRHFKH